MTRSWRCGRRRSGRGSARVRRRRGGSRRCTGSSGYADPWRHYIGWLDGDPVATATVYLGGRRRRAVLRDDGARGAAARDRCCDHVRRTAGGAGLGHGVRRTGVVAGRAVRLRGPRLPRVLHRSTSTSGPTERPHRSGRPRWTRSRRSRTASKSDEECGEPVNARGLWRGAAVGEDGDHVDDGTMRDESPARRRSRAAGRARTGPAGWSPMGEVADCLHRRSSRRRCRSARG